MSFAFDLQLIREDIIIDHYTELESIGVANQKSRVEGSGRLTGVIII